MLIDLTFDLSLPVIMAIFIAQYFVVRKFFLEPLNNVMTTRQTEITSAAARHEEALARFNQATSDMEEKLAEARKKGSAIREALRAEAIESRNTAVAKTRDDADGIVRVAGAELEAAVVSARRRIETESESLARLAAERILGRTL